MKGRRKVRLGSGELQRLGHNSRRRVLDVQEPARNLRTSRKLWPSRGWSAVAWPEYRPWRLGINGFQVGGKSRDIFIRENAHPVGS